MMGVLTDIQLISVNVLIKDAEDKIRISKDKLNTIYNDLDAALNDDDAERIAANHIMRQSTENYIDLLETGINTMKSLIRRGFA